MNENANTSLPWQVTAPKLIEFSSNFKSARDDFERQIGYLLLDVGVETLLRSFITSPNIKTELSFKKREAVAKGVAQKSDFAEEKITLSSFDEISFHNLIEAVKQAAGSKIGNEALEKTEYFHNVRNKIYHLGDGIVPTTRNFEEYFELAQLLLKQLFGVKDPDYAIQDEQGNPMDLEMYFWNCEYGKQERLNELRFDFAVAAELLRPQYTSKMFEKKIKEIWMQFPDHEDYSLFERSSTQNERREKFNKITGKEITNPEFIDETLQDITCLYIAVLIKEKVLENEDYEKYFELKNFAEKLIPSYEEINLKKWGKNQELMDWRDNTQKKLNAWIEAKLSEK